MHRDLEDLGWTEAYWNRVVTTVTEEAQKARVAAQFLPLVGPEDPSTIAVPNFSLKNGANPFPFPPPGGGAPVQAADRLTVDSDPTLFLTTISVNVPLRSYETADPELKAALVMFRRAANYIARIEDSLVFNGRAPNAAPPLVGVPPVYTVAGSGSPEGILGPSPGGRQFPPGLPAPPTGTDVFNQIVAAIVMLESRGQLGPYACVLSNFLFELVCTPIPASLVLPRDRILPFLGGPLFRSSAVGNANGFVVALSGSPVELIAATDINVRFLQTTLEPRWVFRVSERVALRISEESAIAVLG
jgi:uncharacterized linocin/CFP29 family protein